MKKNSNPETTSGFDDRFLSRFPKFVELSKQEKQAFYETLQGAQENVNKRKRAKSGDPSKSSDAATSSKFPSSKKRSETPSADFPEDMRNLKHFEHLTEEEKDIYFATLKKASARATLKKKESVRATQRKSSVRATQKISTGLPEPQDKDHFNVTVNIISKDNERIQKSEKEKRRKIHKAKSELVMADLEEDENQLLLDILARRPQEDISTKDLASEKLSDESPIRESVDHVSDTHLTSEEGKEIADKEKDQLLEEQNFEKIGKDEETQKKESEEIDEVKESETSFVDVTFKEDVEKEKDESLGLDVSTDLTLKETDSRLKREASSFIIANDSLKEEAIKLEAVELTPERSSIILIQKTPEAEKDFEPHVVFEDKDVMGDEEKEPSIGLEEKVSLDALLIEQTEIPEKEDLKQKRDDAVLKSFDSDMFDLIEGDKERESFADEDRKSRTSYIDSEVSKSSGDQSGEEFEYVPIFDKKLIAPKSRVRTLQDLLKDRAVLVVDSTDRFQIEWVSKDTIKKTVESKDITLNGFDLLEEDEKREKKKNKIVYFLEKMCTCGRKETEKEDAVAENLKGESVSVEMGARQKTAASATLDDVTIEVLEAAKRRRVIARYTKQI